MSWQAGVSCRQARESVSAGLDGEAVALTPAELAAHLDRCASCRQWQTAAQAATRAVRLGGPLPSPGLTTRFEAAVDIDIRARRLRRQWGVVAGLVGLCGLVQLAVSGPLLLVHRHSRHGGGAVWHGGWAVALEAVVATSFFAGATVLLWHARRSAEPVGVVRPVEATAATDVEQVA